METMEDVLDDVICVEEDNLSSSYWDDLQQQNFLQRKAKLISKRTGEDRLIPDGYMSVEEFGILLRQSIIETGNFIKQNETNNKRLCV